MLTQGGEALEDSADTSRCYPSLWSTPDGARQAFYRARRVTGGGGAASDVHAAGLLQRATYQRAGAGRRATSLVFDPMVVPPGELRAWLEQRVGPLVRFVAEAPEVSGSKVLQAAPGDIAEPGDAPSPSAAAPAPSMAQMLQQRIRLATLAQRLQDARPKREHGVRQLDWVQWEKAGRAAASLPSDQWAAWRATAGTDRAAWPPAYAAARAVEHAAPNPLG